MRGGFVEALAVGLVGFTACTTDVAFNCQEALDCGDAGACEPTGYCSFPDAECGSGRRYGGLAGAGLAGKCVVPQDGTGSSDGTGTSNPSTGPGSTTLELTTSETTSSTSATSTESTTGMMITDDSGSTTGVETTGGSSSGTTGADYHFDDNFDRPDSANLDNGWVEGSPAVFSIASGAAVISSTDAESYEQNLLMRPTEESVLDVTVEVAFAWNTGQHAGIPQIYARVQPGWERVAGFEGYLCFVSNSSGLNLRRQEGPTAADLVNELLPDSLGPSPVTVRFSVTGTDPVSLNCEAIGASSEVLASLEFLDASGSRIQNPGVVGLSTHTGSQNFRYDDFVADETGP